MRKDIKALNKQFREYTRNNPHDTAADLYADDMEQIIELSRRADGRLDVYDVLINAYSAGFMTAARRWKYKKS